MTCIKFCWKNTKLNNTSSFKYKNLQSQVCKISLQLQILVLIKNKIQHF